MADDLSVTGAIGLVPPPGAPVDEVSQPLTSGAIAEHAAKARQNERVLAPLTYGAGQPPQASEASSGAPAAVQTPLPVQAAQTYKAPAGQKSEYPAQSNTDSPTRGLPGTAPVPASRATAPLTVLGGFGEASAEYYPLDGRELKALAEQLLDELHARIQNDLRFTVAVTYPRVSAKLMLLVEGEADDQAFMVQHVMPPHTKTPEDVAKAHGDSVVFVVTAKRQEFDDQGNVESPPDSIRDELGLEKPRKQMVQNGQGSSMVDVRW